MKHVFIAIGGSGTKVAEALVRLLAVGFPTRKDGGLFTSAGDSLEIWRVDPDRASGAAAALQDCLKQYEQLQEHLRDGLPSEQGWASSRWAIDVATNVRFLDPLKLPRVTDTDNDIKTLRGILDSGYSQQSSLPLLRPFFTQADLDVEIDRGFYQKPFIGSAVMAVFAASLRDENSPGGQAALLSRFDSHQVNFFLCGSLHGGTGACGVPVIGKFLRERKNLSTTSAGWRLGGCLLAPYSLPPQPPFKALADGETVTEQKVAEYLKRFNEEPAFKALKTPEEKKTLINQILLGFYADPDDMESRSRQGLTYYKKHSANYFDELYLVGKPEPDRLTEWSNGGSSQANPLNSAEVVAAVAALNFFAAASAGDPRSYVVGTSTPDLESNNMRLCHLPKYRVRDAQEAVDPERVCLATAFLHHLLVHQIPWGTKAANWPKDIQRLRDYYRNNEAKQEDDWGHYKASAALLKNFTLSLIDPQRTRGWSGEDATDIGRLVSDDPNVIRELTAKTAKRGFMREEAREPLTLSKSAIKASTFEFGRWCPPAAQFSRGEYLRFVWSQLFTRGQEYDPHRHAQ